MSNIRTFGSNKEDKDKKQNQFNVGGATSNTAVLGPPSDENNHDDMVRKLLEQARKNTERDQSGHTIQLQLFKNGFIIDDEPFQTLDDPKNVETLAQLKKGEVPTSLEKRLVEKHGPAFSSIGLEILDNTTEVYTPPPQPFSFSTSTGRSLDDDESSLPTSTGSLSACNAVNHEDNKDNLITLVLQPPSGKRVKLTLSGNLTVAQLYEQVKYTLKINGNIELLEGFPPKPLNNGSLTLIEANLKSACVTVKVL